MKKVLSFLLACTLILMTIPFRCAARHKQEMKPVGTVRSIVKFDILSLREQVHYKVRGGEWMRLFTTAPHIYVYRIPFQAQTSRA